MIVQEGISRTTQSRSPTVEICARLLSSLDGLSIELVNVMTTPYPGLLGWSSNLCCESDNKIALSTRQTGLKQQLHNKFRSSSQSVSSFENFEQVKTMITYNKIQQSHGTKSWAAPHVQYFTDPVLPPCGELAQVSRMFNEWNNVIHTQPRL